MHVLVLASEYLPFEHTVTHFLTPATVSAKVDGFDGQVVTQVLVLSSAQYGDRQADEQLLVAGFA